MISFLRKGGPGKKRTVIVTRPPSFPVMPLLLILGFVFAACSSVPPLPDVSGKNSGSGTTAFIEHVPFYPQEDFQCGPASLAAVLGYRGVSVAPEEIAAKIYSGSARGTLNVDMVLYALALEFDASSYSGGLEDLRKSIDSGHPLIVLVDYGFSLYQANHFMVVTGYRDDSVIVNSGKEEKKFIPMGDFLRAWEKTKFWTLLIKRP